MASSPQTPRRGAGSPVSGRKRSRTRERPSTPRRLSPLQQAAYHRGLMLLLEGVEILEGVRIANWVQAQALSGVYERLVGAVACLGDVSPNDVSVATRQRVRRVGEP